MSRDHWLTLFVTKVLEELHPDLGITGPCIDLMKSFVIALTRLVGRHASLICKLRETEVITCLDIQLAVRMILPEELSKFAVARGIQAIEKYQ